MSETDPIAFTGHPAPGVRAAALPDPRAICPRVAFDRGELMQILNVYGRMVAAGEWRDYAIDLMREKAVFSVFRRSCEAPLYRIEKTPKMARRQGAYCVVSPTGLVLKRGHDLGRVLRAIDKRLRLVEAI